MSLTTIGTQSSQLARADAKQLNIVRKNFDCHTEPTILMSTERHDAPDMFEIASRSGAGAGDEWTFLIPRNKAILSGDILVRAHIAASTGNYVAGVALSIPQYIDLHIGGRIFRWAYREVLNHWISLLPKDGRKLADTLTLAGGGAAAAAYVYFPMLMPWCKEFNPDRTVWDLTNCQAEIEVRIQTYPAVYIAAAALNGHDVDAMALFLRNVNMNHEDTAFAKKERQVLPMFDFRNHLDAGTAIDTALGTFQIDACRPGNLHSLHVFDQTTLNIVATGITNVVRYTPVVTATTLELLIDGQAYSTADTLLENFARSWLCDKHSLATYNMGWVIPFSHSDSPRMIDGFLNGSRISSMQIAITTAGTNTVFVLAKKFMQLVISPEGLVTPHREL